MIHSSCSAQCRRSLTPLLKAPLLFAASQQLEARFLPPQPLKSHKTTLPPSQPYKFPQFFSLAIFAIERALISGFKRIKT